MKKDEELRIMREKERKAEEEKRRAIEEHEAELKRQQQPAPSTPPSQEQQQSDLDDRWREGRHQVPTRDRGEERARDLDGRPSFFNNRREGGRSDAPYAAPPRREYNTMSNDDDRPRLNIIRKGEGAKPDSSRPDVSRGSDAQGDAPVVDKFTKAFGKGRGGPSGDGGPSRRGGFGQSGASDNAQWR